MCQRCEELHQTNIETLKTIFRLAAPFNAEKVRPTYSELEVQLIDAKANANVQKSTIQRQGNLITELLIKLEREKHKVRMAINSQRAEVVEELNEKVTKLTLLNRLQEQNLKFEKDKGEELEKEKVTMKKLITLNFENMDTMNQCISDLKNELNTTNNNLTPSPFEKLLFEHNELVGRVEHMETVVLR